MASSPNPDEHAKKNYEYSRIALNDEQREQLMQLPDSWEDVQRSLGGGNKSDGKRLFSLIKFAFSFLKRLKTLNIFLPAREDFQPFFDGMRITVDKEFMNAEKLSKPVEVVSKYQLSQIPSESENFQLGSKLIEVAAELGLPEPNSANIRPWLSNLVKAENVNLGKDLVKAENVDLTKELSNATEIGNAVIDAVRSNSLDIKIANNSAIALLFHKLSAVYYLYQQLMDFLSDKSIPEPTLTAVEDWVEKYIFFNQCHDLLELLFDMKKLPSDEEMTFLANKYHVLTRQLYKMYYLMYEHSGDCEKSDKDECDCY